MSWRAGVALAILLSGYVCVTPAATDTATFNVTASIVDACDVQAANLAFGNYSPSAGSALDGSSSVSVYCTVGTPYALALNVGSGGGTYAARKMLSGSNEIVYNLYTSAARTTVWGDGTSSTGTVSGTGAGLLTASAHTVYGRIGIGQDSAPGAYTSTITVTLTF
jgi:spore coat protein U-like protein